jgi:AcrR family transcriptional regulator
MPDSPHPNLAVSEGAPKPSQRDRLVNAMIELSAESGFQSLSIAQLSSHAGVSSATFYEQFDGKEDCVLAAYRAAVRELLGELHLADGMKDWSQPIRGALEGLLDAFRRNPGAGRVVLIEARAAGPLLRDERRRSLERFESRLDAFLDRPRSDGETLDVPAQALVGGVRGVIARCLRMRSEDQLPLLAEDMLTWMGSYAVPGTGARWSTGSASVLAPRPPQQPPTTHEASTRLPRGRHSLPAGVVARSQRTRLIYATAEVMMAKGYADTTVADIVAAAGVARDVFYEHFADRQQAFLEAQQHPTQYILDACSAAYFAVEDWPQRVWDCLTVLLELIVANRALSHLRLVGCYAAGPAAIRRAEEITRSFTVFLEEGYSYRPEAHELPRLCSATTAGAIFEVIQRHVADGDPDGLLRSLPQIVYIAIAPFTGPRDAAQLVEQMSARDRAALDFDG